MNYIKLYRKNINPETGKCQWGKDLKTGIIHYNDIEKYDCIGLLVPEDYCFIDFDTKEAADAIRKIIDRCNLKCYELITEHGSHFGFKLREKTSQWTNKCNYYGIPCDFKCGTENESVFERIRTNCVTREIVWHGGLSGDFEDNFNNLDYLPKEFFKSSSEYFLGLKNHDGRNDKLHNHQIVLKKANFSYEEMLNICKMINECVFDEKLTDDELSVTTRRTEWDNIITKKTQTKLKIDYDEFIINLLDNENIMVYDGKLVWYIDNHYTMDYNKMHTKLIELTFGANTLEASRKEIMLRLERTASQCQINNRYVVLANNNLYDLFTGEITNNDSNIKAIFKYNYNYDETAKGGNVEDFIKFLATDSNGNYSKETETQIFEMIGCAIAPNTLFQKAFFLKGDGANGKSVLLRIIQHILGLYCTNVSLKEFANVFSLEHLFKGTCNIIDDLGNQQLEDTDTFKQIVGGGNMTVQAKNQQPYIAKSICTLIIAGNDFPKFGENSKAMERRICFIELNNVVKNINLNLVNELCDNTEGMQWLFTQSLNAYKNAYDNGKLTVSNIQKKIMNEYRLKTDSVQEFLVMNYIPKDKLVYDDDDQICDFNLTDIDIENKSCKELYALFKIWCLDTGRMTLSQNNFGRRCRMLLDGIYITQHTKINNTQSTYYKRV